MTCEKNLSLTNVLFPLPGRRKRLESSDDENNLSGAKKIRSDDVEFSCNDNNNNDNCNSDCSYERLQIEAEFKILQSIIPGVSKQENVSELEIIDACVEYIEKLQHQLFLRYNPTDQQQQQVRELEDSNRNETNLFVRQQTSRHQRNFVNVRQNLRLR